MPIGELLPGHTVALEGDKVRRALPSDEVIGVVSTKPAVVGDSGLEAEGGIPIGLMGKMWVLHGEQINPNWRLLSIGEGKSRYLVR